MRSTSIRRAPDRRRSRRGASLGAASGSPKAGTVFVQGTTTTANLVKLLPQLAAKGLNVKVVAVISPQLFRLQDAATQAAIVTDADRWDSMAITNRSVRWMKEW